MDAEVRSVCATSQARGASPSQFPDAKANNDVSYDDGLQRDGDFDIVHVAVVDVVVVDVAVVGVVADVDIVYCYIEEPWDAADGHQ